MAAFALLRLHQHLRQMRNWQSMMSVMAGLGLHAVARVKEFTKARQGKLQGPWDALTDLTSSANNFAHYRAALRDAEPPAIPYLGLILQDLIGLDESYPDRLDGEAINFDKNCEGYARGWVQVLCELLVFCEDVPH